MSKTALIPAFLLALLLASCGVNTKQIQRMQALEEGVDNPTTIEEFATAIGKYQKRIEDILNAEQKNGIWYKLMATRYLDKQMYGKALENFRAAIGYYPTNQNLYYYVGVCAGYMAKASLDYGAAGKADERNRYYALAESAYLRAIELDPKYERALYGLAVLYTFELNAPAKAIPHLETIMSFQKRNLDAMFVLARCYYVTGDPDKAVALYDKIIAESKDTQRKAEASKNKETVLQSAYGKK